MRIDSNGPRAVRAQRVVLARSSARRFGAASRMRSRQRTRRCALA